MPTPTYPVSTIAKLFNLTERRIQQLASDGVIPKAERGKYDLVASVRGYIAFLQERAFGKEVAHVDSHQERARLLKAQADKIELEVRTLKNELIASDEITAEWSRLIIAFRSRLLSLPTRGAQLVSGEKSFYDIEQTLRELVEEALNELSLYDPCSNPDFQGSKISSAATNTDSEPMGRSISTIE